MEIILSYLVALVALVAISTPLWVRYIPSKAHETELADVIGFIQTSNDPFILEQLIIYTQCRRLLLHMDLAEGYILLD